MKKCIVRIVVISTFIFVGMLSQAQNTLDTSGVRLWLERADLIRGPEHYGEDNYYNSYQISSGSFRGFTANACWSGASGNCTNAMDGIAAWDARADSSSSSYHKNVLSANPSAKVPSWAYCGQWLNSTIASGGTLYGFSHGENPGADDGGSCSNYSHHHKTMTQWTSSTGTSAGLSWANPIEVIDENLGSPTTESGEGDCTAVEDGTYVYLFCRRPTDIYSAVAREPLASLGNSANFIKYDNGWGSQPGVGGTDTPLKGLIYGTSTDAKQLGSGASYWKDQNWMMLLNVEDISFGGIKASFTSVSNLQSNSVAFTTLPEPLFIQLPDSSGHYPYGNVTQTVNGINITGEPVDLYIYPSVISLIDGTRTWDLTQKDQFLLAYTFVPLYNDLNFYRILAMRSVTVSKSTSPQDPQVLVALTTRYDSTYDQRYTSTQPLAVGNPSAEPWTFTSGTFSQVVVDPVAYLAEKPTSQGQTLTKLVECRSIASPAWPGSGHPDHLITDGSCDSKYAEETVAGYSFPNKPSVGNSVEIYRCKSSSNSTHWVANNNTCDNAGTVEKSLGWAVTK